MAESFNVLSWNIQKFNAAKVADDAFVKYVAAMIIETSADLVGLMEIVGWQGQEVKERVLAELKNTGVDWRGAESEMTPSKPHEQYVLFWKKDPCSKLDPSLFSVIGDNDFDSLFVELKYDQTEIEAFWEALFAKGYLDDSYQVPVAIYDELRDDPTKLDLSPIDLTDDQKNYVVTVLLQDSLLGFPYSGSRPPVLANIDLEAPLDSDTNTPTPCLVTLFHAPGPTGTWPMIACSNLALISEIQEKEKSLIMGDFNVTHTQSQADYSLYFFDANEDEPLQPIKQNGENATLTATPFQRLTGPDLGLDSSDVNYPDGYVFLDYEQQLTNSPTSLSTGLPEADEVADDDKLAALRSSAYDNFFLKGFDLGEQGAGVISAIGMLIPQDQGASTASCGYFETISNYAGEAYNAWFDHQSSKTFPPNIIKDGTLTKIGDDGIQTFKEAQAAYRYGISDHLPILIHLEY